MRVERPAGKGLEDAVARHEAGSEPIGLGAPHLPQGKLRSYQGVVAKTADWRTLGASEEEAHYLTGMEEEPEEREMAQAAVA